MHNAAKDKEIKLRQPNFFHSKACRQLPLAFNVSSTHYCGFKMKKKFIERYLLSRPQRACSSNDWRQDRIKSMRQGYDSHVFKISPIKIYDNSPSLLRERLKTQYPKTKVSCKPNQKSGTSVYKTCQIDFLAKKVSAQGRRIRLVKTSNTKPIKQQMQPRPLTANSPITQNSSVRRTRGVGAVEPPIQKQYLLKGWDNECPEYD